MRSTSATVTGALFPFLENEKERVLQREAAREQMLEELTSPRLGLEREEAERRLRDDELWILHPERRVVFKGEEAIEQWEPAVSFAEWLGWENPVRNDAAQQLVWDMEERCKARSLRSWRAYSRATLPMKTLRRASGGTSARFV